MTVSLVLIVIALLLAIASMLPNTPQHHLLAVAVILIAVAGLAGVLVH